MPVKPFQDASRKSVYDIEKLLCILVINATTIGSHVRVVRL